MSAAAAWGDSLPAVTVEPPPDRWFVPVSIEEARAALLVIASVIDAGVLYVDERAALASLAGKLEEVGEK